MIKRTTAKKTRAVVLFVQQGLEVGGVSFTFGLLPEWELPQKVAGCCVAVLKNHIRTTTSRASSSGKTWGTVGTNTSRWQ